METATTADYLVVGAGAAGMAFTDALIEHADVRVVLVDRRHGAGGHWLCAYPFVRLHQASLFYGVASTTAAPADTARWRPNPARGSRGRAPGTGDGAEVTAYYDHVLRQRLLASGRVTFLPGCEYVGHGRVVSRVSRRVHRVHARRTVDAHYLSPEIPATSPAPFDVDDDATVVTVNDLVHLAEAPSQYVVVGSGKTATDACISLMDNGVEPDEIVWIRPREPWMLDRAVVQPDPAVATTLAADVLEATAGACSVGEMFLRLEDKGVTLRIDRAALTTMARTPTHGRWELDRLRAIENVVRLGRLRRVCRGRLVLESGDVEVADDAVVVHAAAPGLPVRPTVPVWDDGTITLQPVRTGFPCFAGGLVGCVEATVEGDDEKNRLCPPSTLAKHATGLGADAGPRRTWGPRLLVRPRDRGLGRRAGAQPRADVARRSRAGRRGRGTGASTACPGAGDGTDGRVRLRLVADPYAGSSGSGPKV